MKQQDVSFFWDGDDLVIAIHNARPDAAAFVSALLMAGGVQKSDGTAEPVSVKPYPAPKKQAAETKTEKETEMRSNKCPDDHKNSRANIVQQVRKALESTNPSDYLKKKNADEAFRELSLYWASKDAFRHKEVSVALAAYMTSRFAEVEDAESYAAKLSDRGVNKFLRCFASAYQEEELELLRKADMPQKREFIAKLIRRCQNQRAKQNV